MSLTPQTAAVLARADRLRAAGDAEGAERECRALLAAHPDLAPALHLLAHLVRLKKQPQEAEKLARRAASLAPGDAGIANTLGNILHDRGDAEGAEAAYGRAAAARPAYAEAHYNRGLMLCQLGREAEALAAFTRATALRPYPEALTQIGVVLAGEGRHEEALEKFDQALRLGPGYFHALYYRGVSLTALQRFEEAETALRAALARKPASAEALHALGAALNYLNRTGEALEAYSQAIEAEPLHLPAHLDFNALAFTLGRADLAYTSFAIARRRAGEVPALLLAEAEHRLRLDDIGEAQALLRRARELAPDDAAILNALGRALTAAGSFDEAQPLYRAAMEREPGNPAHRREAAVTLLHERRPAEAAALLDEALRLAPADQMALALRNLAWRESGDRRHDALTDMQTLVRVYDLPAPAGHEGAESFHRALAEELTALHTRTQAPHDQTLRGGTQTMGRLFGRGLLAVEALRGRIDEAVADYIARMPDEPNHPLFARKRAGFAYSGSWSCRLSSSGYHTNHVHPEGWISSAYYAALPGSIGEGSRDGWISFGQSNLNLGARDAAFGAIRPRVGRLVLFPSYMWHGTVPFTDASPRLTVAFDVVPA